MLSSRFAHAHMAHNIATMTTQTPNFRSHEFLTQQIEKIFDFYYPACMDFELGGYNNQFLNDGTIYDARTKHLVGTCRFIIVLSTASITLDRPELKDDIRHGLKFLREHHRQSNGGYAWLLDGTDFTDAENRAYGHAFVILAYVAAVKAGISEALEHIDETFQVMEERFWEPEHQLYSDLVSADWSVTDPYRGQNANMHSCEAMIGAYEATNDSKYLDRAKVLARRLCVDLAAEHGGTVWEHYDEDWNVSWDHNIDDKKNMFQPYGYQVGHWSEWAKLLLILEEYSPEDWMLGSAELLLKTALDKGWDDNGGGLVYSLGRDHEKIDFDRYYWVLTESFAAAAMLGRRIDKDEYWQWYDKLWQWSLDHLVDHEYGAWYRVLDENNGHYDNIKSPPSKTDYHQVAACWELLKRI